MNFLHNAIAEAAGLQPLKTYRPSEASEQGQRYTRLLSRDLLAISLSSGAKGGIPFIVADRRDTDASRGHPVEHMVGIFAQIVASPAAGVKMPGLRIG